MVSLSAVESSQAFPACTNVLDNDGVWITILFHSVPMMPMCTQKSSGTMPGIVSVRPGILTDAQIRKKGRRQAAQAHR